MILWSDAWSGVETEHDRFCIILVLNQMYSEDNNAVDL